MAQKSQLTTLLQCPGSSPGDWLNVEVGNQVDLMDSASRLEGSKDTAWDEEDKLETSSHIAEFPDYLEVRLLGHNEATGQKLSAASEGRSSRKGALPGPSWQSSALWCWFGLQTVERLLLKLPGCTVRAVGMYRSSLSE